MAHDSLDVLQLDAASDDQTVLHGESELPSDEDRLPCLRAAQGIVRIDDGAIRAVLLRYDSKRDFLGDSTEDVCGACEQCGGTQGSG